jgi:hypothetical protein
MVEKLKYYFAQSAEAAPLAAFRVFFGIMMFSSILRFWSFGWIDKLYLQPQFHFSFYGFEWVKPLGVYTYLIFFICALSAILIALGLWYRLAISIFWLSFTYIELMDKTTYLNHYYFISVLSFLLIFLPAQRYFSVDAYRRPEIASKLIPRYSIDAIKALLFIVYFYAGLAKINSDWLLEAQPLATWLPGKYDLALIGSLLEQTWLHYTFSWGGMLYDLSIPFLLLYKPTRNFAFVLVVIFHVLTRILFPIGMFPYIMIVCALIFFDASFHQRILKFIKNIFRLPSLPAHLPTSNAKRNTAFEKLQIGFITLLLISQILIPWRHLFYPGELFWHEQGFRFSWRVMLMEKAGYTNFKIHDPQRGETFQVDNQQFLSAFQEKQMSFQPDFILEYAHFLEDHFRSSENRGDLQIYAESYVALNGRPSQVYINPKIDLSQEKRSWAPKTWILPFNDTIYGL